MLHTMKQPNKDFNLLFLDYSELLINSIQCLSLNNEKGFMEMSTLHMNTRSFIIVPNNLESQAVKYSYSDSFNAKIITFDEVLLYFQNIEKEVNKRSYVNPPNVKLKKNVNNQQEKRSLFPQIPISLPICSFDFKLINLCEWFNKFILDTEIRTGLEKNNQKTINQIFNTQGNILGKPKDDSELSVNDIINALTKHSYRSSYFVSLLTTINETFPLNSLSLNMINNTSSDNTVSISKLTTKLIKEKEENASTMKYFFLLIKGNKITKITRIPSVKYDISLDSEFQILIITLPLSKLNTFLEDKRLCEGLYSLPSDDQEIKNKIIKKKISDTLEGLGLSRESLDVQSINYNNNFKLYTRAVRILPEGNQYGVLLIKKNNQIQFWPCVNNYKMKHRQFMASEVHWIMIYRYLYKHKALNISLYRSQRSLIFDFDSVADMEQVKSLLEKECFNINKSFGDLSYHTNLWVNGHTSNYDYLLYLNFISSRSFNEPSQYPVFPWIIVNYDDIDEFDLSEIKNYRLLNKPIGAINSEKLERLKKISQESEMGHLYQNHYSTPFKLAYYLIRAFPHFSLRLNSGKHDKSDRIFYSLKDCYEFLVEPSTNHLYELTPEFFCSEGEFLLNINDVVFDKTQEGKSIDNVILPKWAKNPKDFININRSALESEYVSCTLNEWIDLIFGVKQRGKEAENADNLFQAATYDDFDYDNFDDYKKQSSLLSIVELGQTPKKLFNEPHPQKKAVPSSKLVSSAPEKLISQIALIKEEKEKQEKALIDLEKEKESEKEKLEIHCKNMLEEKKEAIKTLKDQIEDKESKWKESINELTEHNNKLKQSFEKYDNEKDEYYKDLINKFELNHKKDIESKYMNKVELFKYVKSLETDINKYKSQEKEYDNVITNLSLQLDKYKKLDEEAKKEMKKIRSKLNIK